MKSKKIFYIIAGIIIVVGSFFYAHVNRDIALYDNDTYSREQLVVGSHVNEDSDFEYTFHCDKNNLTGFNVLFSNQGAATGTITYAVYDEKGNLVSEIEDKKVSSLKNGKYTFLKLDKIKESKGNDYTIKITCDNNKDDSVIIMQEPQNNQNSIAPGVCYVYNIWSLETMIVVILYLLFLLMFARTLVRIFRK